TSERRFGRHKQLDSGKTQSTCSTPSVRVCFQGLRTLYWSCYRTAKTHAQEQIVRGVSPSESPPSAFESHTTEALLPRTMLVLSAACAQQSGQQKKRSASWESVLNRFSRSRARIEKWLKQLVEVARRKPRNGLDPNCDEAVRRRKDTANRNLTVLKAALNRCLTDGKVACSGLGWRQVRPFKGVGQTRTRFLSDPDARKLVTACSDDFQLLVQGALFSGARYSELTHLLVFDFDPTS